MLPDPKGTVIVGQPLPTPPPDGPPANSWNSESGDLPLTGGTDRMTPVAPLSAPAARSAGVPVTETDDADDSGVVFPPGPPGAPLATLDAIVTTAHTAVRPLVNLGSRAERRSAPARFDWAQARADVEAARQAVEALAQLVYGEKD